VGARCWVRNCQASLKHRNWNTRQSCIYFVLIQHASEGGYL
jgi:hypothetical protein